MKELDLGIERCILSLGEKFLKWPLNFFTESDAHSFLYYYIFRFGPKSLKILYPSINPAEQTVLVHREYPTSFRFRKEDMQLSESGGRGHYDLVILNPEFLKNHTMSEIIAKDFEKCQVNEKHHLLAAIEFKFVVGPLSTNMREEIKKDFRKLSMALDQGQSKNAYLIVFNRFRPEDDFRKEFLDFSKTNRRIKGLYIESTTAQFRQCKIVYLNDWIQKLRFGSDNT